MENFNKYMMDAMNIIAEEKIKNAPFDKTDIGTIVDSFGDGKYIVSINGENFKVESSFIGLDKLDKVYIKTRGNNKNKKYICGTIGDKKIVTNEGLNETINNLSGIQVQQLKNIFELNGKYTVTYFIKSDDVRETEVLVGENCCYSPGGYDSTYTIFSGWTDDYNKLDPRMDFVMQPWSTRLYAIYTKGSDYYFYLRSGLKMIDESGLITNQNSAKYVKGYCLYDGTKVSYPQKFKITSILEFDNYSFLGITNTGETTGIENYPIIYPADENGEVNIVLTSRPSFSYFYGRWEKQSEINLYADNPEEVINQSPLQNVEITYYSNGTSYEYSNGTDSFTYYGTATIKLPSTFNGKTVKHWNMVGYSSTFAPDVNSVLYDSPSFDNRLYPTYQ